MTKNPLTLSSDAPPTLTGEDYWRREYNTLRNTLDGLNLQTYSVTLESIIRHAQDTHEAPEVRLRLIETIADAALRAVRGKAG